MIGHTPCRVPACQTDAAACSGPKMTKLDSCLQQSRSLSTEFILYYLVLAAAACKFTARGFGLSKEVDRIVNSGGHGHFNLRPGWLLGANQDLSDIQWRVFREGVPAVSVTMLVFILLKKMGQKAKPESGTYIYMAFGVCLAGYLHQASFIFPLVLSLLNFGLTSASLHSGMPVVIWTSNWILLLTARLSRGGSFGSINHNLAFLDAYQGPLQWQISYNLIVLRHISFAMDKYWARSQTTDLDAQAPQQNTCKAQQKQSLPMVDYNLWAYLAYIYYPPLYIAGPICTFNAFAWQCKRSSAVQCRQVCNYAVRLACSMLLLEAMSHSLYFNSITRYSLWQKYGAQLQLTAVDMGIISFWVLMFMWLKFLVIWRFFRLWALADGMDVPENMLRCICNNYDIEGFWKGWHASFNQWLVRYIYVPLGGSATRLLNIWLIFTFVALWHDLEWHLLGWAWLTCILFVPELGIKWLFMQPSMAFLRNRWYFRHICALGGCCNIIGLMAVNMVGFVVGTDGIAPFLKQCMLEPSFVLCSLAVCFSAVQIMFEIRVMQQRQTKVPMATQQQAKTLGHQVLTGKVQQGLVNY
ncbi:hypothetical protein ABBQ32_008792 [Trebouxia sp. C0010 RCD-2024]